MAGGIERYFQIARCFRNEDLRADRQPEFTQIDLEMALVGEEDIISLVTDLVKRAILPALQPSSLVTWCRMSYAEAMATYGSDKPDLRFSAKIQSFKPAEEFLSLKVTSDSVPRAAEYGFEIPKDHSIWTVIDEAIEKVQRRPQSPGWSVKRVPEGVLLNRPHEDHVGSTPMGDLRLEIAKSIIPGIFRQRLVI